MKQRPVRWHAHLGLRLALCLVAALLIGGCHSSDARARDALAAYQSAAAANDLPRARRALLELVQAKDDVPDYWVELGKLQGSMGSYGDAYYAFSRAYELDRTNVDVLRAVTQLALRSGDLTSALRRAGELEILDAGDPWPKIVKGWAAINESHFDEAISLADSVLAISPFDSTAVVLKARGLVGLGHYDDARALLIKQTNGQPSDGGSLRFLARLCEREDNWGAVFPIAQRLSQISPGDENALFAIEAAFRSDNLAAGREASRVVLKQDAPAPLVHSVLALWENYWPSPERVSLARDLAAFAIPVSSRLVYANFLSRVGSPGDAIALSAPIARLPVTAENSEANAVLGDAAWRSGQLSTGVRRLNAVLAFDPSNETALSSRVDLNLRLHNAHEAVVDAQKLTTAFPNSADYRLLLARSYAASGDDAWVGRTLWRAFQEIPASEKLLAALKGRMRDDPAGTTELGEEFERQKEAKLGRGLV